MPGQALRRARRRPSFTRLTRVAAQPLSPQSLSPEPSRAPPRATARLRLPASSLASSAVPKPLAPGRTERIRGRGWASASSRPSRRSRWAMARARPPAVLSAAGREELERGPPPLPSPPGALASRRARLRVAGSISSNGSLDDRGPPPPLAGTLSESLSPSKSESLSESLS